MSNLKLFVVFALLLFFGAAPAITDSVYYTVPEGAKVILECKHDIDARQILWIKDKMAVLSLDGEDWFTFATMLNPQLKDAFRLVGDQGVSSLIIDDASMDDLEKLHATQYKCMVDLTRVTKYEVSIIKRDLRCVVVEDLDLNRPIAPRQRIRVVCTVTKDKSHCGKLDFILFVGRREMETRSVFGRDLWKESTQIARVEFSLKLEETFRGESISVAIDTSFQKNDVEFVVTDRLQFKSYEIRIECPSAQRYVLTTATAAAAANENGKVLAGNPPSPPYCLVYAASPLLNLSRGTWQIEAFRSETTLVPLRLLPNDVASSTKKNSSSAVANVYGAIVTRDVADKFFHLPRTDFSLAVADVDSSLVNASTVVEVYEHPEFECIEPSSSETKEEETFDVGFVSYAPVWRCSFRSRPIVRDFRITFHEAFKFYRPIVRTVPDQPAYATTFVVAMPARVDEADRIEMIAAFQKDYYESASGDWTGRYLPSWPSKDIANGDENGSSNTSSSKEVISRDSAIENQPMESEKKDESEKQNQPMEIEKNDVEARGSENDSRSYELRMPTPLIQSSGIEKNDDDDDSSHLRPTEKEEELELSSSERRNAATTPASSRDESLGRPEILFSSEPRPENLKFSSYFRVTTDYRLGDYEKRLEFVSPALDLKSTRTSLLCEKEIFPSTVPFTVRCRYLSIPPVDPSHVSVLSISEDYAERISGSVARTDRGFDVEVEDARPNQRPAAKTSLIIRIEDDEGGKVEAAAEVKVDYRDVVVVVPVVVDPVVVDDDAAAAKPGSVGEKPRAGDDKDSNHAIKDDDGGWSDVDGSAKGYVEDKPVAGFAAQGEKNVGSKSSTGSDSVMDNDWFFPTIGVIGGVVLLTAAIAIYAGIRRRRANPPRIDRHRVQPEEDHDGFAARQNSVASNGEPWTGDGGVADVVDDDDNDTNNDDDANNKNTNNNNDNNNDSDDNNVNDDSDNYEDVESVADVEAPLSERVVDVHDALIVPDQPPSKIKTGSFKAMQSFPTTVVLSTPPRKMPQPQADVDV